MAVAGTRPNYVKLAPLARAARAAGHRLDWIDTGQHTAAALTRAISTDLALPAPRARLRAPPAGPGRVAGMAEAIGRELERLHPTLVAVLGDVDGTLAAALAAWRLDLPLAHVEAGLRAFDRGMPEERNRVLVDAMSDRLHLSEPQARAHLLAEGAAPSRMRNHGNVMADALHAARPVLESRGRTASRGLPEGYVVATLHRQANVDDGRRLAAWLAALERVARDRAVVLPLHPRTRTRLGRRGAPAGVRVRGPLPYLSFLGLVSRAAAVITDSGGLQVEAALLGVPCVTLRRRTEHELTLAHGGNRLAGGDPRRLARIVTEAIDAGVPRGRLPRAWDGHAAARIVADWGRGFRRPGRLAGPDPSRIEGL